MKEIISKTMIVVGAGALGHYWGHPFEVFLGAIIMIIGLDSSYEGKQK